MKIAVVGVTGLVGAEILRVMEEVQLPVTTLIPVASERSVGKKVEFQGKEWDVVSMEAGIAARADFAIFSAGGQTSLTFAPQFAAVGTVVVDNSSAWRMHPDCPLLVPGVNLQSVGTAKIIANPNCSTIQMVMALAPLHKRYKIRRLLITTFQSVSGTGKAAVDQLVGERTGNNVEAVYPHPIDLNVIPQCDVFTENDYTKEEMKMVNETRKILGDNSIQIAATCVRVPVLRGHSEALNIEFEEAFEVEEIKALLAETADIIVQDNPSEKSYPTPLAAAGKNEVFVGRIRRDISHPNALNMWVVADNLRIGAATNAVRIVEALIKERVG